MGMLAGRTQAALLAPGAVVWSKLDQHGSLFDAVVLGAGSKDVLVYRGTGFDAAGNPIFAALVPYAVGQNPAGVTIADVNGDGILDMLVVNQGSNDVSVLFGAYDANGQWIATPGPRLKTGGSGPIAVAVRDVTGRTGTGVPTASPTWW